MEILGLSRMLQNFIFIGKLFFSPRFQNLFIHRLHWVSSPCFNTYFLIRNFGLQSKVSKFFNSSGTRGFSPWYKNSHIDPKHWISNLGFKTLLVIRSLRFESDISKLIFIRSTGFQSHVSNSYSSERYLLLIGNTGFESHVSKLHIHRKHWVLSYVSKLHIHRKHWVYVSKLHIHRKRWIFVLCFKTPYSSETLGFVLCFQTPYSSETLDFCPMFPNSIFIGNIGVLTYVSKLISSSETLGFGLFPNSIFIGNTGFCPRFQNYLHRKDWVLS